MHYVLFGLDLSHEQFGQLYGLYFNPGPGLAESSLIVVLMRYIGDISECMGDKTMAALPARRAAAIELYVSSPAMRAYTSEPLPVREFLDALVTILGLAGLQGPLGAASHILLNYKGCAPRGGCWHAARMACAPITSLSARALQVHSQGVRVAVWPARQDPAGGARGHAHATRRLRLGDERPQAPPLPIRRGAHATRLAGSDAHPLQLRGG